MFRIAELVCTLLYGAYFLYGKLWLPTGIFGILSATLLFAIFWENNKNRAQYVHIDEKGVQLPATSRRRELAWNQVAQVILRFGILTIDCYDNHLYQWNVKMPEYSKEELEGYCSKLIAEHKEKQEADW